ncbi:MAG TPA: 3'-5' exonuclease [Pseudonocardiaceae bacterium]|nr:3'-5' exonuclease [Pseudonocardiaceae bacterium]
MREDLPWTSARLVVADVEGNGRRPPSLVEVALVPIVAGRVGEPVSWLVRPPEPITWQATRVHGITNQEVADLPGIDAVAEDIRAHLGSAVVVAHNAPIDLDVLTRELPGWQPAAVVDTLKVARLRLPGQASYRLGALVDAFHLARDLPTGLRPHRASYDALVTARLFVHLATDADGGPLLLADLTGTPAAGSQPDQLF